MNPPNDPASQLPPPKPPGPPRGTRPMRDPPTQPGNRQPSQPAGVVPTFSSTAGNERSVFDIGGDTLVDDDPAIHIDHLLPDLAGIERFEFGPELGRGGLGVVQQARDRTLWRETAIKLVIDTTDERNVARFIEEAQITGQLEHPNIVPVHELGRDAEGRPFMAMKRVRGHTLMELIERARKAGRKSTLADLTKDRRLDVFLKVCDAIAYAHSRGVIHRDLKPANIMVGEFGEVLVMDWGIARPIGASARGGLPAAKKSIGKRRSGGVQAAPTARTIREVEAADGAAITLDGEVLGTPSYMPPEQAAGEATDERSDVFALGATLYHALTFQLPYRSEGGVWMVVELARRAEWIAPRQCAPHQQIPPELDAIVCKAMAPDPRDRYRRVSDLRDDIEAFLANQPISARRDGIARRLVKWARRHPAMLMVGTVTSVSVVLLGLAVSLLWAMNAEKERVALEQQMQEDAWHRQAAEQEQAREQAELAALAKDERIGELLERFGVKLTKERNEVVAEFEMRRQVANASGQSDLDFMGGLPGADAQRFIEAFERVVKLEKETGATSPDPALNFYYLSMLCVGRKDYDRAIGWADQALKADRTHWKSLVVRSVALEYLGRKDDALADLDRAADMAKDVIIYINRGELRRQMGDFDGALKDFLRGVELAPGNADAWQMLGDCYAIMERWPDAMQAYDRALLYAPMSGSVLLQRAMALFNLGHAEAALQDAELAVRLLPENKWARNSRGVARTANKLYDEAIADLTKALEIDEHFDEARINRAYALAEKGDFAAAIPDYVRGLKGRPEEWKAWFNLGVAYANTGAGKAKAVAAFREAQQRCTNEQIRQQIEDVIRNLK
ncbi:MAG: protein kinase [Planctomycetota bacterium]